MVTNVGSVQDKRCKFTDEVVRRPPDLYVRVVCYGDESTVRRETRGADRFAKVEVVEHDATADVNKQRATVFVQVAQIRLSHSWRGLVGRLWLAEERNVSTLVKGSPIAKREPYVASYRMRVCSYSLYSMPKENQPPKTPETINTRLTRLASVSEVSVVPKRSYSSFSCSTHAEHE